MLVVQIPAQWPNSGGVGDREGVVVVAREIIARSRHPATLLTLLHMHFRAAV